LNSVVFAILSSSFDDPHCPPFGAAQDIVGNVMPEEASQSGEGVPSDDDGAAMLFGGRLQDVARDLGVERLVELHENALDPHAAIGEKLLKAAKGDLPLSDGALF